MQQILSEVVTAERQRTVLRRRDAEADRDLRGLLADAGVIQKRRGEVVPFDLCCAAVEGGDVVDCDTTFASWNYDGWNGHTTLYSAAGIELGSKDFFITRFPNQQPDDGIYVMNYVEGTDNRNVSYTTTVTPNTEYTFSMYYKDLGNSLACFMVDGTTIIDGGYNVQNGAVYDPYEGKVTYKFTPAGGSVTIAIDSHGKDWHFCNNFRILKLTSSPFPSVSIQISRQRLKLTTSPKTEYML